ncbi:MAG: polysaccharide deacetylase family protein [Candidatus Omnitrophica bacterium]|nr:polysaccharide deacetylase family protein [Candidatus Omnitrophota bacterium]
MLSKIKKTLMPFICSTPVTKMFETLNQGKLRILFYHRIAPAHSLERLYEPTMFVEENEFEDQMRLLRDQYQPVCEQDVIEALKGNVRLPGKAVWVTFDDGYKDNFLLGYPILKKWGIRATFFVATDYIDRKELPWEGCILEALQKTDARSALVDTDGRTLIFELSNRKQRRLAGYEIIRRLAKKNILNREKVLSLISKLQVDLNKMDLSFMSWDNIREMADNGSFIGSHTVMHRPMTKLSRDEVSYEIGESKRRIEECIGRQVFSFSYPYGKCPASLSDPVLFDKGIEVAVTAKTGPNDLTRAEKFRLGRFDLGYRNAPHIWKFKLATCRFWAKLKEYTAGAEVV